MSTDIARQAKDALVRQFPKPGPVPAAPRPPDLPVDVFGPWQAWIDTAAKAASAPPDYVAFALLTSAAALIGNARTILPDPERSGWAEPVALWCAIVGPPSSGKTPALAPFEAELDRIEKEVRANHEGVLAEHQTRCDIADQVKRAWQDEVRKAAKTGNDRPEKPDDAEPPEPVKVPRLLVRDATIEKMAVILNASPKGLLQWRDELAGWFNAMERYSGTSNRPHWLEMYNGKRIVVDRVKHEEPIEVETALVSILGGIQPDKLSDLVAGSVDDGLFARFIYCASDIPPLRRAFEPVDEARLRKAFSRLHGLNLGDQEGVLAPLPLGFSPDSAETFFRFRQHVRDLAGETSGLLAGWIGKAPGLVARLAGVLSFLDWADCDAVEPPETISEETAARAIRLWQDYLLPMARLVLQSRGSPIDRAADEIMRQTRRKGLRTINARQVRREWGIAGLADKTVEAAVWSLLVDDGLMRRIPKSGPGRKARDYEIIEQGPDDAWDL
ncbi:MAG: YfjI family protein [Pseudomonadota bacterium]